MDHILLVEDDASLRRVLQSLLEQEGFSVSACVDAETATELLGKREFACVLADFRLPGKDGLELLSEVRTRCASLPYLLMTAYGSIDIAVEAMKRGANDFISKPFEPEQLRCLMHEVIQHRQILDRTGSSMRRHRSFLTADPVMEKQLEKIRKVARVDSPVLLLGESGTGKELIARYIHDQSPRRVRPFLAINCAAVPASLLESELFGHVEGAFTGATQHRSGIFEHAAGGTIFLDEVVEMPPALQAKLLRVLQERVMRPVGSDVDVETDVRIVAATNKEIEKALEDGALREDFYYRIAVVSMKLPPLRERPKDIELLINYYLDYFSQRAQKARPDVLPTAHKILLDYSWPGNARELENVIERAVILADRVILPEQLGINPALDISALLDAASTLPEIAGKAARQAEMEVITSVLKRTNGNKSKAAQILGVSYKTLLIKVKEYGIGADALL